MLEWISKVYFRYLNRALAPLHCTADAGKVRGRDAVQPAEPLAGGISHFGRQVLLSRLRLRRLRHFYSKGNAGGSEQTILERIAEAD